ncbi:hypothetical protein GEV39_23500 [Pseudomonas sp. NY5710]|nr:hypothetical protein GEV39_23500 [Pseudomonas sp. NY5710]
MDSRGRCAAHRRQASSHRYCTSLKACGDPVRAGVPAMGCKAAPKMSDDADFQGPALDLAAVQALHGLLPQVPHKPEGLW